MTDATAAPTQADQPDPDRAVPARLHSTGTGKVLLLLRTLIAYGKNLVETLRQNDYPEVLPWYALLTRIFDTTDPALITVTVIRGLLRATALQARLGNILPLPLRDGGRGLREGPSQVPGTGPGPRRPRAAPWVIPPGWPAGDTSLDRLPTPEEEIYAEIIAEDHHRPIAAILLDICLDLGIVAVLTDPATWDELVRDLTLYGGDPATLLSRSADVQNSTDPAVLAAVGEAHSAAGPPAFSPLGDPILTSPPWLAPPEKPPPLAGGLRREADQCREADRWGRRPGP